MPPRPSKPCRHPGCSALSRDGSGLCAAHITDKPIGSFSDSRRGTAAERGYGSAWAKLRNRIMLRDCGLCQVCARVDRVMAAQAVDHIIPKSQGGTDQECNLQAICRKCHDDKTAAESGRGRGIAPLSKKVL